MRRVIVGSVVTVAAFLASASPAFAISTQTANTAYNILIRSERKTTHIKVSLATRSAAVGKLLAPSLETAQGDYKNGTIGEVQADDLVNEASVQYVFSTVAPVERLLLARDEAIEKLNIPAADKRGFSDDATLIKAALALDTVSDLTTWQNAGWSTTAEPAGTKQGAAIANGDFGGATATITVNWLDRALTVAKAETLNRSGTEEVNHVSKLTADAHAYLKKWLAAN